MYMFKLKMYKCLRKLWKPLLGLCDTIGGPMPGKDPWEPDILDIPGYYPGNPISHSVNPSFSTSH